jgi:hypothetical protein
MRRIYNRPNADWPERLDRFYITTRSLKDNRVRVTMFELNQSYLHGSLDATRVVFSDFIAMLDAVNEVGKDLEADGWELDTEKPRRRKRA